MRGSVIATIALPDGKQIQIAAVHWPSKSRKLQQATAERLIDVLAARPSLILAGDFNLEPQPVRKSGTPDNALDFLLSQTDLKLTPADAVGSPVTFPSNKPIKTIDWIFAAPPARIEQTQDLRTDLSDHLSVSVGIVIE